MSNVKKRVTYQFAENIGNYVDTKSEEMGLSKSAFVTLCIASYKQAQDIMEIMQKEQMRMEFGEESEANT